MRLRVCSRFAKVILLSLAAAMFQPSRCPAQGAQDSVTGGTPTFTPKKPASGQGNSQNAAIAQRRDYARHWTPVHVDFVVPEIQAAVARARAAGAVLEGDIAAHEWGRIALMADPFGHGFQQVKPLGSIFSTLLLGQQGEAAVVFFDDRVRVVQDF